MIWVGYTTLYREAGPKFARVAKTLADSKRALGLEVKLEKVESKRDFVDAMTRLKCEGATLEELHFIGHGGMYGIMFRTRAMPEQFSPHEWRMLARDRVIPFVTPAHASHGAYFHACRSARWFTPFFARTFGVPAFGYHGYTTLSTRPDAFRWERPWSPPDAPLYVVACPGKKSHGLLGSALKYSGLARVEVPSRCEGEPVVGDVSYDAVADLYDATFTDISVRADECRWLDAHLSPSHRPRVLDIGCGNGALLRRLAPRIASGVGVDRSARLLEHALTRSRGAPNLSFASVDGPTLPFADGSFDVVTSLLSFRYLDWDPIMSEICRVLAPGGRILIVDMVSVPLALRETPLFLRSKLARLRQRVTHPRFDRALRAMVGDPRWRSMLAYNPIRSAHELTWYLESRFPGQKTELLNTAWSTRVVGFDSGPITMRWVPPQSYP